MKELPCWTIMNCDNQTCAARYNHGACWELAQGLEDHRAEFNICADCLVHVLKTGGLLLSAQDLSAMPSGRACPLGR